MLAQKVVFGVLISALLFGGWFIATHQNAIQKQSAQESAVEAPHPMFEMSVVTRPTDTAYLEGGEIVHGIRLTESGSDTYAIYDQGNFAFRIPDSWAPVAQVKKLPMGYTNPKFLLKKQGTTCVIGYFDQEINSDLYAQTGFGERTFSEIGNLQFDTQWYAPQEVLPEDFQFSFGAVQPAQGEVYHFGGISSVPTYAHRPNLILFNETGGMVHDIDAVTHITQSSTCVDDMTALLRSYQTYFAPFALDADSRGYVFVNRSDLGQSSPNPQLYFEDTTNKQVYVLNPSPTGWGSEMALSGKNLEAVDGENNFIVYSLYDNAEVSRVRIPVEGTIIDRYAFKGRNWLLVRPSAVFSETDGATYLYEWSRDENAVTLLGSYQTRYPRIRGYDSKNKTLIVGGGYGDAGCMSEDVFAYSEIQKNITPVGSYATCGDEPESTEQKRQKEQIKVKIAGVSPRKTGSFIEISDFAPALVTETTAASKGYLFIQFAE